MAPYTDRGFREISAGLSQAQRVLRRRRETLQGHLAAIESELRELTVIESSLGAALEVLKSAAAARTEQP